MSPNSVAVVDYGMGNLRSVAQAVIHAAQDTGVEVKITSNPQDVRDATRVVLPGQGAMPDCMRELRESGLLEAVLEAATLRLRPILMTTGAMVLGAVPLAVATGAGSESRIQIGLVIVGGMTLGTLLTLFVVPTFYTLLTRRHRDAAPA